ncbi:hypothetical protein Goklo_013832, partial [Gossypium klotzschianum]|nr:hypothetical protein [Gossypium klotzschianum]
RASWTDKSLGGLGSRSIDGVTDLDLQFENGDILRSTINGILAIYFSDHLKKFLVNDMETTMVFKLLGRNIGYGVLHNHIVNLWKHSQPFRIIHVANGYYLVRFHNSIDYNTTLTQGPWIVFGHYLIVQPWTMDFNTLQDFPNMVLAWICFLSLSRFLHKKQILEEIGSLIWESHLPCKYRLMVEWNEWSLRPFLRYDFFCGKYGHIKSLCPSSLTGGNSHSDNEASPSLMNSDQFWHRLEKPTRSRLAFAGEGCWTGFEGFRSWTDGAGPRMDLEEVLIAENGGRYGKLYKVIFLWKGLCGWQLEISMSFFLLVKNKEDGLEFTWQKKGIVEHLDRAICNNVWNLYFLNSFGTYLPRLKSHHRILKLSLMPNYHTSRRCPFRWNKYVYGHIATHKKFLTRKLQNIEIEYDRANSVYLNQVDIEVRKDIGKCVTS